MVRGIDKTNIFRDNEDKARFLERLGLTVSEGKCTVYAWVLMDNHVHILFKSGKQGISAVILCDQDNYLLALIRYIHLIII